MNLIKEGKARANVKHASPSAAPLAPPPAPRALTRPQGAATLAVDASREVIEAMMSVDGRLGPATCRALYEAALTAALNPGSKPNG